MVRSISCLLLLALAGCRPPPPAPPAPIAPTSHATRASVGGAVPTTPPPGEVASLIAAVDPAKVHAYVRRLAGFGTRHTLSDTRSEIRGIGAARRWLQSEFKTIAAASGRSGESAMKAFAESFQLKPDGKRIDKKVELVNVLAVLPGTMPQAKQRRYYVVGHYDSRNSDAMDGIRDAPGANDDASGVAVVLELARVLSRGQFDSTLVFLATAGEEQGLLGAKLHAEQARKAGIAIYGVLNNDIVGDPTGPAGERKDGEIRVFSDGLPGLLSPAALDALRKEGALQDSSSRQLARYVAMIASWQGTEIQPVLVLRPDRFLRGGDHLAFHALGFPALRFTEMQENYDRQHQDIRQEGHRSYGDLPEYVDAEYLADVARLNAAAIVHLANAPMPPQQCIIVNELGNDSKLRWAMNPEPDLAGYEVLWRSTQSASWEQMMDIGKKTQVTLQLGKDDWFFGVRAYDKQGYRSPVAFPRPQAPKAR